MEKVPLSGIRLNACPSDLVLQRNLGEAGSLDEGGKEVPLSQYSIGDVHKEHQKRNHTHLLSADCF
jgi:hypothetical protein